MQINIQPVGPISHYNTGEGQMNTIQSTYGQSRHKKSGSVSINHTNQIKAINQSPLMNSTLEQNQFDNQQKYNMQTKFTINQKEFQKMETKHVIKKDKITLAQTLLSNTSPKNQTKHQIHSSHNRSNSSLKQLLGLSDNYPREISIQLNIKDHVKQKRQKPTNSTLNKSPSSALFDTQGNHLERNIKPLERLEKSASGGLIPLMPNQILAQSNPFGQSKKSILTVKQADNLQTQKMTIHHKLQKQNYNRKQSVQPKQHNIFPNINQNAKLRNLQNVERVQEAQNQSLDRIYNIPQQPIFQGMSNAQSITDPGSPTSAAYINSHMNTAQQQQMQHQMNLNMSKLNKTRLKQAIQKQFVEYSTTKVGHMNTANFHRNQGMQQLQDLYQNRQLVARPKGKEITQAQKNQIRAEHQILIQNSQYQKMLMENYNEKSKRLDFIQKLINQSKQKQKNTIKYDQAFIEGMQKQIDQNEIHLLAAQMDLDNISQQDNQNIFHQQPTIVSDQEYYDYRRDHSLQNLHNVRGKSHSTQQVVDKNGNSHTYRMVDIQNKKAQKERGHSFFSPQVQRKNNAANFFKGDQKMMQSPGQGMKSIRFENTVSAMSMISQTQGRENNNSKMSKIIEGLTTRKDSELRDHQTEEEFVKGAQTTTSKKSQRKQGDRYIDININTNMRQYNTDSEQIQGMKGQIPNSQMPSSIVMVPNKFIKNNQGSKLRLTSAILDKEQLKKLQQVQMQMFLSPQNNNNRQSILDKETFDSIIYPQDGLEGLEVQGEMVASYIDQHQQELLAYKEQLKNQSSTIDMSWLQSKNQQPVPKKYYYNKNSSIQTSHDIRQEAEKQLKETLASEYRELFAKLGLDYELDVPKEIREQLKFDKNAKQILVDLGNELEQSGEVNYLKRFLQGENQQEIQSNKKNVKSKNSTTFELKQYGHLKKKVIAINKQELKDGESPNFNPNACFSVKPGEPTTIKIWNEPIKKHQNHPINKYLKLINDFCYLTMLKAANYRGTQQKSAQFDMIAIQSITKQFKIDIPKNANSSELQNLFKSKQFIVQSKGIILQKLFHLMNKENDLDLQFERQQFQFYKGFIGKGNNTPLIVQLFKQHRWWWTIYQSLQYDEEGQPILPYSAQQQSNNNMLNMQLYKESFVEHNFLWTQWKKLKHFSYLKTPTKEELQKQQEKVQAQAQKEQDQKLEEMNKAGGNNGNVQIASEKKQSQNEGSQNVVNLSNSLKVYAKLENNYHLSNKYALFYNMRKYYKALNRDPFEVLPLTFHVKSGLTDPEYSKFLEMHKNFDNERNLALKNEKDLLKRVEFLEQDLKETDKKLEKLSQSLDVNDNSSILNSEKQSQEDSVEATNSSFLPEVESKKTNEIIIDEKFLRKMHVQKKQNMIEQERIQKEKARTQEMLNEYQKELQQLEKPKNIKNIWIVKPGENTNRGVGITVQTKVKDIQDIVKSENGNSQRTFIIQKYIETPALYKQRKFDIRCFALIQSINGHLKGFNYEDGYLRTCGREYNLKTFNKFIHLTNDAVQKRSEDYGRFEFGNKVSFQEYQAYLNQTVPHLNIDFRIHIFSQIKRLMTDSIRACYKIIDPNKRQHSFEILGFDFMLDDDYKVYLIEANTNPCLETTCPILHKVITDVVDSAFRLALDPLFPPPTYQKRMSQQVPLMQWELCYDSKLDDKEMDQIYADYDKKCQQEAAVKETADKDEFDETLLKEEELDEVYD